MSYTSRYTRSRKQAKKFNKRIAENQKVLKEAKEKSQSQGWDFLIIFQMPNNIFNVPFFNT